MSIIPPSSYADHPARWLVVYNTAVADSSAWAEYYRQARGIPPANLCGLNLATTETIDAPQYAALNAALNDYLDAHGLSSQILGLLLGYRVPGYVDRGAGQMEPVPALLHMRGSTFWAAANPLASLPTLTRPTSANLAGTRLTARIDAPDLPAALALIDRATTLQSAGLGDGAAATIWLNPFTVSDPYTQPPIAALTAWANSLDRMRTRLPLRLATADDPLSAAPFPTINHDGFFWGWAAATPPAGFFAAPAGRRVCGVPLNDASATALTLRGALPSNWADTALAAGYAAAAGSSRVYSSGAVPLAGPFFAALRLGWTLAEAWFLSLPFLREGMFLVGDPLLTTAFPRAGWDVFGPLARLEHLDPQAPAAVLREEERTLALPAAWLPPIGEQRLYLLRHSDAQGRSDAAAALTVVVNSAGQAVAPVVAPVWPDAADWPVLVADGLALPRLMWAHALRWSNVKTIELLIQPEGDAAQTLAQVNPNPDACWLESPQNLPTQPARYAWRLTSAGGAAWQSFWSAPVYPLPTPPLTLQLVEEQP